MLMLAFFLAFSTIINIAAGLHSFFIKDFFQPMVFIRMALIAAVMASFRFGEKQIKQLVIVMLVISLLLIALAFAQKYIYWRVSGLVERLYGVQWTELTVSERVGKRVGGTFGNSNVFSLCLVGLGLAVLVGTASRTGVLALVMVSGILLLLSFHGKSRVPAIIFMILLFVVLSLFLEHAQELPLHPRIKELVGEGGPIKTINEKLHVRYTMWQERWGEIKESPIWGQGERKMYRQLADNGYVIMLLRMGVIGLSVYLFMLFSLLVRGKRALRIEERRFQRTLLLVAFIVLINHMIFELTGDFFWNVEYSAIFAAFMGLLCGLSAQARLEQDYLVHYDYEYATEAETYQTTADPLAGGQHDAYEHI
jgi:O-antigen ligase